MKKARYSTPDTRHSMRIAHRGRPALENPESRIQLRILILCLTFVPLNLLVSLTNIASANTATKTQQPLPQTSLTIPQEPNNPAVQQLLRARISVIDVRQDQQSKDSKIRLEQVIEQVRAVRFGPEPGQPPAPAAAAPATAAAVEPNQSASDMQVAQEQQNKETESAPLREQVTGETLQRLKDLLQHPEKLDSPLDLGEVLFASGHLADAAAFYNEALKRIDPNDANASGDRAWILFQIGNCLRNSDRPTAAKTYGQLLTEYPQSPWTQMAKAEGKLIDWYLKDDPRSFVDADKAQRPASQ